MRSGLSGGSCARMRWTVKAGEEGLVSWVGVIVRVVAVLVRRSAGGERRWWGLRAIGVVGVVRGLDFDFDLEVDMGVILCRGWLYTVDLCRL